MSAKEALAKLSTQLNKPLSEYASIDVAVDLANNIALLSKLEPFCLPEITKLICGSSRLIEYFGDKYLQLRPFFEDTSAEAMMEHLADKDKESSYYIEIIFPLADDYILDSFIHAYNRLEKSIKYHQKLTSEQENEVLRTQAKIDSNAVERKEVDDAIAQFPEGSDDEKYKDLVRRRSSLKGNLTKYNKTLEAAKLKIAEHQAKCDAYREQYLRLHEAYKVASSLKCEYATRISNARRDAYEACDDRNVIQSMIEGWFTSGVISEELVEGLRNYDFCVQFVSLLEKSYQNKAVAIISALYENGLIDIADEPFSVFLSMNSAAVANYFVDHYLSENGTVFDVDAPDFDSWCDYIINAAFFDSEDSYGISAFDTLWGCISSPDAWRTILDAVKQQDEDALVECLARLILCVSGNSRKHLILATQDMILQEEIESCSALVVALIDKHTPGDDCSAIVELLVQRLEGENRKLKGTNERLKFNADRLSSKAYGALSKPIESLEILASNIASSHNSVQPEMVSSKLKKYLTSLREGLEVFELYTVEDATNWINRKSVPFDPEKHSISIPTPPQTVYLRTLGFTYRDITREEKTVPAVVGRLQELDQQAKPNHKVSKPRHSHQVNPNGPHKPKPKKKQRKKGGEKE